MKAEKVRIEISRMKPYFLINYSSSKSSSKKGRFILKTFVPFKRLESCHYFIE